MDFGAKRWTHRKTTAVCAGGDDDGHRQEGRGGDDEDGTICSRLDVRAARSRSFERTRALQLVSQVQEQEGHSALPIKIMENTVEYYS